VEFPFESSQSALFGHVGGQDQGITLHCGVHNSASWSSHISCLGALFLAALTEMCTQWLSLVVFPRRGTCCLIESIRNRVRRAGVDALEKGIGLLDGVIAKHVFVKICPVTCALYSRRSL
jgi:hypothetical protein